LEILAQTGSRLSSSSASPGSDIRNRRGAVAAQLGERVPPLALVSRKSARRRRRSRGSGLEPRAPL